MRKSRLSALAAALLSAMALAGCAAGTDVSQEATAPTSGSSAAAEPGAPTFSGDTRTPDGRTLFTTCWGDGETTVVYLHGLIMPQDGANWAHAPELQERLAGEVTYCEYERANVGKSSSVDGPIPIEQTVADLDAVLTEVQPDGPVVLVGGSFGGVVAVTYAGTHPDAVDGVVLLDPSLPGSNALEEAMLPPEWRLAADAWNESGEKIDVFAADTVALAALDRIPQIPGTVFVTEEIELPPVAGDDFLAAIRAQQQDLADRFSPGQLITVDAPHAMISVVPDEIAEAILQVVDAAG
ncbi:alpha/beta fold hydrolase [Agromyces sp. NPDC056523]|uniref:alpha/beta fold hydrolase n=1 Tax=Agromyces sp. NPDC056523 TaxID=3345850 RepID=UPI00366AD14C